MCLPKDLTTEATEITEKTDKKLRELSALCGKGFVSSFSPAQGGILAAGDGAAALGGF